MTPPTRIWFPTRPTRPGLARPSTAGRAACSLLAALLALGLHTTAAPARAEPGGARWQWPLAPRPVVTARFDAPPGPYAPGHRGVDLAARVGQEVLAAGAGVVSFAGPVAGRGVVAVIHPDGRRTTYEPVAPLVSAGEPVAAGEVLGRVSAAPGHCLPATCLHWGLRRDETYLDPLSLLGAALVRLLPVWTAPDRGPLLAWRSTPRSTPR
jgi:murein DD-endopeptidase MepM/ murein hydrolase activator NlpD